MRAMLLAFLISFWMTATDPSVLTVQTVYAAEIQWTVEDVKSLALEQVKLYNLPRNRFMYTLECENGFRATGQSQHINNKGEREQSFGAVQINLPSHPGITQEMSEDPYFAVPWMAEQFAMWNASMWSCYTNKYGAGSG